MWSQYTTNVIKNRRWTCCGCALEVRSVICPYQAVILSLVNTLEENLTVSPPQWLMLQNGWLWAEVPHGHLCVGQYKPAWGSSDCGFHLDRSWRVALNAGQTRKRNGREAEVSAIPEAQAKYLVDPPPPPLEAASVTVGATARKAFYDLFIDTRGRREVLGILHHSNDFCPRRKGSLVQG